MAVIRRALDRLNPRIKRLASVGGVLLVIGAIADLWTVVTQVIPGVGLLLADWTRGIDLPGIAAPLWEIASVTATIGGGVLLMLVAIWLVLGTTTPGTRPVGSLATRGIGVLIFVGIVIWFVVGGPGRNVARRLELIIEPPPDRPLILPVQSETPPPPTGQGESGNF